MNDLESRLKRALAESAEPTHENFVNSVAQRVDAYESTRRMRLFFLTLVAICLTGLLGYGLRLSWNAARGVSISPPFEFSAAASILALALVAIALFASRPRTHSDA